MADGQAKRSLAMRGVVGALVVRDQNILLVRGARGRFEGEWVIPTGEIEPWESPSDAALRETLEETGVEVTLEGLAAVCNVHWEDEPPYIYLMFLCRHAGGEPHADGKEIAAARYFSINEILSLDEPIREVTVWIAKRVLNKEHHLLTIDYGLGLPKPYVSAFV